ncbi:EGF domain-specific O-linked N-acetylglucosamine transferase-like isoform X2 [Clavelina lepadiformis]|uniref:EGF domain-specific O-linked N-acetylglucosamine transferase-like isoform X2 n=1 Tax=Clavelina lepadiformis TaxID=159417 RepID=UPI004041F13B
METNLVLQMNYKSDGSCWGYEPLCMADMKFGREYSSCASKKEENDFWELVDFGYVKKLQDELLVICKPNHNTDSYLYCTKYTRYCRAKHLYLDFTKLLIPGNTDKYREDVFEPGQIGGHCSFDKALLESQSKHKSPLQSWYAELQQFSQLPFKPMEETRNCDIVVNKTVVLMKLDYGGNMFHHFCDFFNLYVSQHVNDSWFGQDIQIVNWDTANSAYFDLFPTSWQAFTKHPTSPLVAWHGKRVCIRDVMFPLLPRMRRGLYYNTYVPGTCVGSNLFRAFSEHFLYRMNIPLHGPLVVNNIPKVKVTLLRRGNPKNNNVYRQIKNQDVLVSKIRELSNVDVKVVEYNWKEISFKEQLTITRNTDIFIGMHGAGLTHFLFLPDWAVAIELYNCGDKHCYHDLARLRGVHYMTWPKDPSVAPVASDQGKHAVYGNNPKFWNWTFDPDTFKKIVQRAVEYVLKNNQYQEAAQEKMKTNMKAEL